MTDARGNVTYAGTYMVGFHRATLRHNGYPWYRCIHKHETPAEAKACARAGKIKIDALPAEASLPPDWQLYRKENP